MHKLIKYVCDELDELERKADKDGKLSMAETQYMDVLAHARKNLLTGDAMMEAEDEGYSGNYSNRMYPTNGGSYADGDVRMGGRSYAGRRNAKRDSMGRYSSRGYSRDDGMVSELRELMQDAPNEQVRQEFQRLIDSIERM